MERRLLLSGLMPGRSGRVSPFRRLALALSARRQRIALARLEDRLLDDAGIDRDAARAEAARPIWDVPVTWLR